MFSQKNRVKRKQFEELLKTSFICHTPSFSLRSRQNQDGIFRFAVVVSKKVAKTAVQRNLLKRRVRTVVESLNYAKNDDSKAGKASSVVLFLKKEGAILPFQALKREIIDILKKARI